MTRPRIAIAGFQHETNTVAPMPTRLKDFACGYIFEEGSAAFVAARRRVSDGAALEREPMTAYPDGRDFMLCGDCPCLIYGPKSENIHGFDERMSLASIRRTTRNLALFVTRWCGLTPHGS